ncbi:MAG: 50S ribosomal protein L17 [Thermodesulfobacteriota bacterium]|nr:50S ribosomal protein L17 [Thermodesulfobacteriota bacterium]
MRHRKAGLKLNRTSSHRKAMFRNMVTSLIKYEKIRTTDAKAKEIRRWGDKLVTLAKRGDLHARRQALAIVRERAVVKKLFDEAPGRFGEISGGYTRVVKLGRRPGDAAAMSLVAFVTPGDTKPKKSRKKKATPPAVEPKPKEVKAEAVESKEEPIKEASDAGPASPEAAVAGATGQTTDTVDTIEETEAETETPSPESVTETEPRETASSDTKDDADAKSSKE